MPPVFAALDQRREQFSRSIALGFNPEQAYIAAGYASQGARRNAIALIQSGPVANRIKELRESLDSSAFVRASVTRDWVIEKLKTVATRCLQEEAVLDSEGKETGEYRFNAGGAVSALKLLGTDLGMFVERSEVKTMDFGRMTRADLERMVSELEAVGTVDVEGAEVLEIAAPAEALVEDDGTL